MKQHPTELREPHILWEVHCLISFHQLTAMLIETVLYTGLKVIGAIPKAFTQSSESHSLPSSSIHNWSSVIGITLFYSTLTMRFV